MNPQHEIRFRAGLEDSLVDCMRACLQRDVGRRIGVDALLVHAFFSGVGGSASGRFLVFISYNIISSCVMYTFVLIFLTAYHSFETRNGTD
jgi:hypothetical protein